MIANYIAAELAVLRLKAYADLFSLCVVSSRVVPSMQKGPFLFPYLVKKMIDRDLYIIKNVWCMIIYAFNNISTKIYVHTLDEFSIEIFMFKLMTSSLYI